MFAHTKEVIKNLGIGLVLMLAVTIIERNFNREKKVQTKSPRNTAFWAWGCLIALALLGWANSCLNAQQVPVFYGALRQGIIGQTVCNKKNELAIIINDGYNFDSTGLARVIEHELVHVSQIRGMGGSCLEAAKVYAKDPMAQEIPAYCPELRARMKASNEPHEVFGDFVLHIYNVYGIVKKMDVAGVARRVEELCPGG